MNVICYNFETNLEPRTYFVADIGPYLFFCDFSDVVFLVFLLLTLSIYLFVRLV